MEHQLLEKCPAVYALFLAFFLTTSCDQQNRTDRSTTHTDTEAKAVQITMDPALPIPLIDIAVSMRALSGYKSFRTQLAAIYSESPREKLSTLETEKYLIIELIGKEGAFHTAWTTDFR